MTRDQLIAVFLALVLAAVVITVVVLALRSRVARLARRDRVLSERLSSAKRELAADEAAAAALAARVTALENKAPPPPPAPAGPTCGPWAAAEPLVAGDAVRLEFDETSQSAIVRKLRAWPGLSTLAQSTAGDAFGTVASKALAVDCTGRVFVGGSIAVDATATAFAPLSVPAQTAATTPFIAQLDGDTGAWASVTLPTVYTGTVASVNGLAADCDGNVYLAGSFTGTLQWGASTLLDAGSATDSQAFVVKMDSTGAVLWSTQSTSGISDSTATAAAVAVDCTGRVGICGAFSDTEEFGDTELATNVAPLMSAFAATLDGTTGAFVWAVQSQGGANLDAATCIAFDCQDAVFVGANFNGGNVQPLGSENSISNPPNPATLGYVVALNATTGRFGSAAGWTGNKKNDAMTVNALAVDCRRGVYVVGSYKAGNFSNLNFFANNNLGVQVGQFSDGGTHGNTYGYVWKMTASESLLAHDWVVYLPSDNTGKLPATVIAPNAIAADCSGNLFVAGTIDDGSARAGDLAFAGADDFVHPDAFFLSLTADGNFSGASNSTHTAGAGTASATALAATCQGAVYALGTFGGTVQIGPDASSSITSLGQDLFVARLASDGSVGLTGIAAAAAAAGDMVTPIFNATATGDVFSGLEPGADYLQASGDAGPTKLCACSSCARPNARFMGTACTATSMLLVAERPTLRVVP